MAQPPSAWTAYRNNRDTNTEYRTLDDKPPASAASSVVTVLSARTHSREPSSSSTIDTILDSTSTTPTKSGPTRGDDTRLSSGLQRSPSLINRALNRESLTSPRRSLSLRALTSPLSGNSPQRSHRRSPSTNAVLRKIVSGSPERPQLIPAAEKEKGSIANVIRRRVTNTQPAQPSEERKPLPAPPMSMAFSATAVQTLAHRAAPPGRPPGTAHSNYSFGASEKSAAAPSSHSASTGSGSVVPNMQQAMYQHIIDTASKRISTLDYLRKAHEGRIYWFNTVLMSRQTLNSFPSFNPNKLARRATNLLLLGYSLPTILDLNSSNVSDYLKALTALLAEFEQYQTTHSAEGDAKGGGSLSRGRLPGIFKRAVAGGAGTGKNRRASSANDSSSLFGSSSGGSGGVDGSAFAFNSLSMSTSGGYDLSDPNYTYLLTAPLPFDPDFFEVFATLCDILIDCYTRITQLVGAPSGDGQNQGQQQQAIGPGVGELFTKADGKIRKLIVANTVREFEEKSREGIRTEVAGIGKVVLGGLM